MVKDKYLKLKSELKRVRIISERKRIACLNFETDLNERMQYRISDIKERLDNITERILYKEQRKKDLIKETIALQNKYISRCGH